VSPVRDDEYIRMRNDAHIPVFLFSFSGNTALGIGVFDVLHIIFYLFSPPMHLHQEALEYLDGFLDGWWVASVYDRWSPFHWLEGPLGYRVSIK